MVFSIEVDGNASPEGRDCLDWSRHNQIAICTPKIIYLIRPFKATISCHRGFVSYEDHFQDEKALADQLEHLASTAAGTLYKTSSWTCRRRSKAGFKKCAWWSNPKWAIDRLVILTYAGELLILQCSHVDVDEGRNWKPIDMPAIKEISIKYTTNDIFCSHSSGALSLCTEDGALLRYNDEGTIVERRIVPLLSGEVVSRIIETDSTTSFVATSHGRIIKTQAMERQMVLIDDGVLLPGPMAIVFEGKRLIIGKFNRIYIVDLEQDSNSVQSLELPNLSVSITVIIDKIETITVGTDIGKWYSVSFQNSLLCIDCLITPPWIDEAGAKGLIDVAHEVDSDDDTEDEEEEFSHKDSANIGGIALSIDGHFGYGNFDWILETKHRPYPTPDKSILHLCLPKDFATAKGDGSDSRSIFMQSMTCSSAQAISPSGQTIVLSEGSKCCVCDSRLEVSKINDLFCSCLNGHFFEICSMTGRPIPGLNDTVRCFNCRKPASADRRSSHCRCGGPFLLCS